MNPSVATWSGALLFALLASISITAPVWADDENIVFDQFQFDGLRFGDSLPDVVMQLSTFSSPCDTDPIEDGAWLLSLYTGLPCDTHQFPEDTSVALLAKPPGDSGLPADFPVAAFAWMGGKYFTERSDFPLYVGAPVETITAVIDSEPEFVFERTRKERTLFVRGYPGQIRVLVEKLTAEVGAPADSATEIITGFALGEWPVVEKPEDQSWADFWNSDQAPEAWRAVMSVYFKMTPVTVPE